MVTRSSVGRRPALTTSAAPGSRSATQCWKCGVALSGHHWSSKSLRFLAAPPCTTTASKPLSARAFS
nr:hypothetical protein [Deltaproteobacteria bacterium]